MRDVKGEGRSPPDGGGRAWAVMIAAFLCNGIIFSIINTYSVIYVQLQKELETAHVSGASSKAALVGSLAIGTTFFLSPVAGILTDLIGIQRTGFIGGAIAALGMLLSSFLTDSVEWLYVTYGLLYGGGASLVYTPSLVILGHYFKKYIGMVNGFVTAGSSIFTMVMPYYIYFLLESVGLSNCFRVMAGMMLILMACSLLFKPLIQEAEESAKDGKSGFRKLLNTDIWKEKKYVYWALIIPLALFGYFVPYVHMVKFVSVFFPEDDGKVLVLLIGVSSGIGRLVFGRIADNPKINRIFLQQFSFICIGCLTMLMTVTPNFLVLKLIALGMGLFDGCFISLLGPIAFDICGQVGAGQAIGFLLGFCSIPLTLGPPVAGLIYDKTGSYTLPFLLAGVPPILGGLCLSIVYFVGDKKKPDPEMLITNGLPKVEIINGAKPSELHSLVKENEEQIDS